MNDSIEFSPRHGSGKLHLSPVVILWSCVLEANVPEPGDMDPCHKLCHKLYRFENKEHPWLSYRESYYPLDDVISQWWEENSRKEVGEFALGDKFLIPAEVLDDADLAVLGPMGVVARGSPLRPPETPPPNGQVPPPSMPEAVAGPDSVGTTPPPTPKLVTPPVALGKYGEKPRIRGKEVSALNPPRHNVIGALLKEWPERLSKDELVQKSGHSDAVNILKRLVLLPEWASVIELAGERCMGYGIARS
jgi:hypothetical protein